MTVEGEGMNYRLLQETAVHVLLVGLLALQHLQADRKQLLFTSKTRIYKDELSLDTITLLLLLAIIIYIGLKW